MTAEVDVVVGYLVHRHKITSLPRLHTLLYFAHATAVRQGQPLVRARFAAWEAGPIVLELVAAFGDAQTVLPEQCSPDGLFVLSRADRDVIDDVVATFEAQTDGELARWARNQEPWQTARRQAAVIAAGTQPLPCGHLATSGDGPLLSFQKFCR